MKEEDIKEDDKLYSLLDNLDNVDNNMLKSLKKIKFEDQKRKLFN